MVHLRVEPPAWRVRFASQSDSDGAKLADLLSRRAESDGVEQLLAAGRSAHLVLATSVATRSEMFARVGSWNG
jgi:hypothetical protein